jgi:dynein heavy chain
LLRQAGDLKRQSVKDDPNASENSVLKRALRDFNMPKIVADDRMVFEQLIEDLFPKIDAPFSLNKELKEAAEKVVRVKDPKTNWGYQDSIDFIKKIVEMAEILGVRHSLFLIGVPGTCKTAIWKSLIGTNEVLGILTKHQIANPKAVNSDEL